MYSIAPDAAFFLIIYHVARVYGYVYGIVANFFIKKFWDIWIYQQPGRGNLYFKFPGIFSKLVGENLIPVKTFQFG